MFINLVQTMGNAVLIICKYYRFLLSELFFFSDERDRPLGFCG